MADELHEGPRVVKGIGDPVVIELNSLIHQGPAVTLYLWAELVQGGTVIYEPPGSSFLSVSVSRHDTPTLVNLLMPDNTPMTFELAPAAGVTPQLGDADAMIVVAVAPSLDPADWLLRAVWTGAYNFQAIVPVTLVTNLTAVFR